MDDNLNEINTDEVDTTRHNQQDHRSASQQLTILHRGQIEVLGEGRLYFTRTPVVRDLFTRYKTDMTNYRNVVLDEHTEDPEIEVVFSSTPKRRLYSQNQVDSIKRQVAQENTYQIYLIKRI